MAMPPKRLSKSFNGNRDGASGRALGSALDQACQIAFDICIVSSRQASAKGIDARLAEAAIQELRLISGAAGTKPNYKQSNNTLRSPELLALYALALRWSLDDRTSPWKPSTTRKTTPRTAEALPVELPASSQQQQCHLTASHLLVRPPPATCALLRRSIAAFLACHFSARLESVLPGDGSRVSPTRASAPAPRATAAPPPALLAAVAAALLLGGTLQCYSNLLSAQYQQLRSQRPPSAYMREAVELLQEVGELLAALASLASTAAICNIPSRGSLDTERLVNTITASGLDAGSKAGSGESYRSISNSRNQEGDVTHSRRVKCTSAQTGDGPQNCVAPLLTAASYSSPGAPASPFNPACIPTSASMPLSTSTSLAGILADQLTESAFLEHLARLLMTLWLNQYRNPQVEQQAVYVLRAIAAVLAVLAGAASPSWAAVPTSLLRDLAYGPAMQVLVLGNAERLCGALMGSREDDEQVGKEAAAAAATAAQKPNGGGGLSAAAASWTRTLPIWDEQGGYVQTLVSSKAPTSTQPGDLVEWTGEIAAGGPGNGYPRPRQPSQPTARLQQQQQQYVCPELIVHWLSVSRAELAGRAGQGVAVSRDAAAMRGARVPLQAGGTGVGCGAASAGAVPAASSGEAAAAKPIADVYGWVALRSTDKDRWGPNDMDLLVWADDAARASGFKGVGDCVKLVNDHIEHALARYAFGHVKLLEHEADGGSFSRYLAKWRELSLSGSAAKQIPEFTREQVANAVARVRAESWPAVAPHPAPALPPLHLTPLVQEGILSLPKGGWQALIRQWWRELLAENPDGLEGTLAARGAATCPSACILADDAFSNVDAIALYLEQRLRRFIEDLRKLVLDLLVLKLEAWNRDVLAWLEGSSPRRLAAPASRLARLQQTAVVMRNEAALHALCLRLARVGKAQWRREVVAGSRVHVGGDGSLAVAHSSSQLALPPRALQLTDHRARAGLAIRNAQLSVLVVQALRLDREAICSAWAQSQEAAEWVDGMGPHGSLAAGRQKRLREWWSTACAVVEAAVEAAAAMPPIGYGTASASTADGNTVGDHGAEGDIIAVEELCGLLSLTTRAPLTLGSAATDSDCIPAPDVQACLSVEALRYMARIMRLLASPGRAAAAIPIHSILAPALALSCVLGPLLADPSGWSQLLKYGEQGQVALLLVNTARTVDELLIAVHQLARGRTHPAGQGQEHESQQQELNDEDAEETVEQWQQQQQQRGQSGWIDQAWRGLEAACRLLTPFIGRCAVPQNDSRQQQQQQPGCSPGSAACTSGGGVDGSCGGSNADATLQQQQKQQQQRPVGHYLDGQFVCFAEYRLLPLACRVATVLLRCDATATAAAVKPHTQVRTCLTLLLRCLGAVGGVGWEMKERALPLAPAAKVPAWGNGGGLTAAALCARGDGGDAEQGRQAGSSTGNESPTCPAIEVEGGTVGAGLASEAEVLGGADVTGGVLCDGLGEGDMGADCPWGWALEFLEAVRRLGEMKAEVNRAGDGDGGAEAAVHGPVQRAEFAAALEAATAAMVKYR